MDALLKDLKHSIRLFRQSPAFTWTAVAALALGIGANTAIFSVVNSVLLKPAPFPEAERIVMLLNTSPQGSGPAASPAKFQHWREQSAVLQDVSAFRTGVVNLTGGQFPEQLRSGQVSADFFRLFGALVSQGRTFSADEDRPHGAHVAVISDGLWVRHFGRDPNILNKTISLGGEPHTVIGVLQPGFDFRDLAAQPDVWIPFQLDPNSTDQGHYFRVAARLKPGVALAEAKLRLQASGAEFRRKYPASDAKQSFSVESIRESLVSDVRPSLMILVGAVGFVLLIACANVANLLLARAVGRQREIAVRTAIGAGRGRIIRQLLTESVLLSSMGAILGALLGIGGIRALLTVNTAGLPRVGEAGTLVSVDWRVLLFTIAVALGTGLLFGLIPALQISRTDVSAALKESGGRSGTGLRQNKTRTALVVSELALAVVLLIGAALLIRTSLALGAVNPGFQADNVLTMRMSLAGPQYSQSAAIDRIVRDGTERLRAIPGVVAASATCCVPLEGGYGLPFRIMGRPADGPFHGGGGWQTISSGHFDVFRIPLRRGRVFTERDNGAGTPVVIINDAMARKFWPNSDPLNDKILIGKGVMSELSTETPRQIVGIVADIRGNGLDREPGPVMYVPNGQVPDALNALNVRLTPVAWTVRTQGDPYLVSAAVQEQLRQVTGLPVSDIRSMNEVIARSTSRQRFNMLLMTIFAGVALGLAAIGIYGLMAYSVQQRTQEIGIRLALGAETADVRRMIVSQGMVLATIGIAVGLAAAFGLTRLLATFLYGVKERDLLVFLSVPVALALVALVAVWFPARRATGIDPLVALRYE